MRKKSSNLTLNSGVKKLAKELGAARSFSSLTSLVEQLIRDEYERRVAPMNVYPESQSGAVLMHDKINPGRQAGKSAGKKAGPP